MNIFKRVKFWWRRRQALKQYAPQMKAADAHARHVRAEVEKFFEAHRVRFIDSGPSDSDVVACACGWRGIEAQTADHMYAVYRQFRERLVES